MKAEEEEPNNILVKAVSSTIRKQDEKDLCDQRQVREWSEWLKFGESTDDLDLKRLENGRKDIVETWQRFREHHHETTTASASLRFQEVPNINTLREIVGDAQVEWETKRGKGFGKVKRYVSDFLDLMNDHSYLFKFIPAGDKYISLITGVVSSVVKTCVNYKRIAEGFFSALVDLSGDLRLVQKKTDIWDSLDMRRLVVDYYVMVFQFLCSAMSWFSRPLHRYRSMIDKNFFDNEVKGLVDGMKATVVRIRDEAAHLAERQVQQIKDGVDRVLDSLSPRTNDAAGKFLHLQIMASGSRDDDQGTIEGKLHHFGQLVGTCSIRALQDVEANFEYDLQSRDKHGKNETPRKFGVVEEDASETESLSDETWTRYDLQKATLSLSTYTEDGSEEIANALRGISTPLLPQEVLNSIRRWIASPQSRMIWIEGMPSYSYGSKLSLTAMQLCTISMRAQIACVSFFCKPSYKFASGSHAALSNQEASTVALLYSVIAQLARLIPADFQGSLSLYQQQFQLLDGSIGSAFTALQIIQDLLIHSPPSVVWIIDGLQLAESKSTIRILDEFLGMLRNQEKLRTSKACFTTDGNSYALLSAIRVDERVDASRVALAGRGQQLPGGGNVFIELNRW
ncbi:hypothetical protein BDW42DRAFT_193862 [Aspergillus taichungensis]|uniref:Fungal STAND N-terminal Goodbye domain-containing protein n=1 Tax=Aspergillus taichungensis TaxID=482145 RepID=A0A2J5HVU8_9EURO|nr:hypothetical protein BDW42DRAFT_193862 [Aspergillus taichungensis]